MFRKFSFCLPFAAWRFAPPRSSLDNRDEWADRINKSMRRASAATTTVVVSEPLAASFNAQHGYQASPQYPLARLLPFLPAYSLSTRLRTATKNRSYLLPPARATRNTTGSESAALRWDKYGDEPPFATSPARMIQRLFWRESMNRARNEKEHESDCNVGSDYPTIVVEMWLTRSGSFVLRIPAPANIQIQ